MVLRLEPARPVVDQLKGHIRVRVGGTLVKDETTGQGKKHKHDEQLPHRGKSNQLAASRSRGIQHCGVAA